MLLQLRFRFHRQRACVSVFFGQVYQLHSMLGTGRCLELARDTTKIREAHDPPYPTSQAVIAM